MWEIQMRMCSLASGSSGNCIYAGSETTHLLIDAGLNGKRTEEGLAKLGLSMREIDGILITHEHVDHIQGVGVLSRKYQIPIYCTEGTKRGILSDPRIGKVDEALFQVVAADQKYTVKDMAVTPIGISHDAAEPVGYKINYGRQKGAVVTDLGVYNDYIVEHLKGLDILFLEANHDVHMLQAGPYPYPLKRRILSERGHLSNEMAGKLLCRVLHDHMRAVVLSHLSRENNLPELAYETVRTEIMMSAERTMSKLPCRIRDLPLYVAKRDEVSEVVKI